MSKKKSVAVEHLEASGFVLNPFQERVATVLGKSYRGIHNMPSPGKHFEREDGNPAPKGWETSHVEVVVFDGNNSFHATYDNDALTRLVLFSHVHNVRFSIMGHTHRYLKLVFMDMGAGGFFRASHPTIEEQCKNLGITLEECQ